MLRSPLSLALALVLVLALVHRGQACSAGPARRSKATVSSCITCEGTGSDNDCARGNATTKVIY